MNGGASFKTNLLLKDPIKWLVDTQSESNLACRDESISVSERYYTFAHQASETVNNTREQTGCHLRSFRLSKRWIREHLGKE